MRKLLLIAIVGITFMSCKKENKCWKCHYLDGTAKIKCGTYQEVSHDDSGNDANCFPL